MRSALISLVFLQSHCIVGWPLLNINLAADSALSASVAEMNKRSLAFSLYRATYMGVSQIKLVDFSTYDFILNFRIRDQFQRGLSKPEQRCSSYARVSRGVMSLRWMSCSVYAVRSSSEEI